MSLLSLDLELLVGSLAPAATMAREVRASEDEEKVEQQMTDHDCAGQVPDLELDDRVIDPGSEHENCVHHLHQHHLIKVLTDALCLSLIGAAANDDNLGDDLSRHQEDLPDEGAADDTDSYTKHVSPHEKEAGNPKNGASTFHVEVRVELAILQLPLLALEFGRV